ncbi:MAG TPA: aldo/keto reductase [Planctomycetota bacterium]|nr:aldo/keto reductase [Planctomycetota bacterium]
MPTRRQFLRLSAAAAAAAGALGRAPRAAAQDAEARKKALEQPLAKRALGKTGLEVTALGLGCFYLGSVRDASAAEGVIRRAYDLGVNWFDTAPSYNGGVSEERVGRALKGVRDRVFIATKSTERSGRAATAELEASLKRLGTDRVDLFQFHALRADSDAETIFGEGGAHQAILEAKKAGKVRHIGFTGHYDPALMAKVCRERPVETVLMPLNALDPHSRSFEEGSLPAAKESGLGIVAMKVFASGRLVDDPALSPTPEECIRWSLSLPVSTAIVGCSSLEELERDLACAKTFVPLTEEERKAILRKTRPFVDRRIEWYKR